MKCHQVMEIQKFLNWRELTIFSSFSETKDRQPHRQTEVSETAADLLSARALLFRSFLLIPF